jgi:Ca2+-binding RTX toxin-like protein
LIVGIISQETEEFDGTLRIVNHYAGSSIAYIQADLAFNAEYGSDATLSTIYFTPDLANGIENAESMEVLIGTNGADVINGNGGYYDWLTGRGGDDTIHGGDGFDNIRGGDGNDWLYGDAGDDRVRGDRGDDYLDGGDGFDIVHYNGDATTSGVLVDLSAGIAKDLDGDDENVGTDTLVNFESVVGSGFGDVIIGDSNANTLSGRGGDDELKGEDGLDFLFGDDGDDTLFGEAGNDGLIGDDGDDTLDGGSGSDYLAGGPGHDTFVFSLATLADPESDSIDDFSRCDDVLQFEDLMDVTGDGFVDLADLEAMVAAIYGSEDAVSVEFTNGLTVNFGNAGAWPVTDLTHLVEDPTNQIIVS